MLLIKTLYVIKYWLFDEIKDTEKRLAISWFSSLKKSCLNRWKSSITSVYVGIFYTPQTHSVQTDQWVSRAAASSLIAG